MGSITVFLAASIFATALLLFISPFSTAETLEHNNQGFSKDSGVSWYKVLKKEEVSKKEQDHTHEVHCSRERSKAAWNIIEEYLLPFVEREKYNIPKSCRLHPDNDLFRDHEEHKIYVDVNQWSCGYCKKSFLAEKFLDQHLESRHNDLLNSSQSKCLADLCGAMHCDHFMKSKSPKSKCNPAAAMKNRHMCESLAHNCFPVKGGPSANRLHELFMRQFCDAHTCSGGIKPFQRGGRKYPSIFYLAVSILTMMLLPLFYLIVCLHQSEIRNDSQKLRRIKWQRKEKPS